MLIGLKPSVSLSEVVREVKNSSTNYIKPQAVGVGPVLLAGRFRRFLLRPFQVAEVINSIRDELHIQASPRTGHPVRGSKPTRGGNGLL